MKKHKKLFSVILVLIAVVCIACALYLSDFYSADPSAAESLESCESVTVTHSDRLTVFSPALPEAGFFFYPGGKVEFTAYAPLMRCLAQKNIFCVLVKMPGNLAILDMYAAEDLVAQFPDIDTWYIGGHSLGGSSAAYCAEANPGMFRGLILLASYSAVDLTGSGMDVISLYGSEDGVLNHENYKKNYKNLPGDTTEVLIQGGNHSLFGSYGHQEGDGTPSIDGEQQIRITADAISEFIEK